MIMLLLGAIFLVVGAGLLALGFVLPGPGRDSDELITFGIIGLVFAVIGVIFVPIGVYMLRSQARDRRIRSEGIEGTATILDIGETNMTINDRPVLNLSLQVTVPGRSPYTVEKRITMPWNALGRIAVGASVPVKVDRTDPEDIVIEWNAAPAFGLNAAFPTVTVQTTGFAASAPGSPPLTAQMSGTPAPAGGEALIQYLRSMGVDVSGPMATVIQTPQAVPGQPMPVPPMAPVGAAPAPPAASSGPLDVRADEAELRKSGIAGRATIRGAEDLGVGAQGKRLVRLELEVTPTGRTAYPLQHVTMAPEASMPRLAPGTSLAVHVDAANPQNVAIDWDGA